MNSWIAFKREREWAEFWQLANRNPRHFALVAAAAAMHYGTTDRPMVITSLYRPRNSGSVHSLWRGTDIRVEHRARITEYMMEGCPLPEAQALCDELNDTFQYLAEDGSPKDVAILHGKGLSLHIHLQTPGGRQWKA